MKHVTPRCIATPPKKKPKKNKNKRFNKQRLSFEHRVRNTPKYAVVAQHYSKEGEGRKSGGKTKILDPTT